MFLMRLLVLLTLISTLGIISCSNNSTDEGTSQSIAGAAIVQQGLLDFHWTLETVRSRDGLYRPLPLDATWRISFNESGAVWGNALCNAASGTWQLSDTSLSIFEWFEDGAYCVSIETIDATVQTAVTQMFAGEALMPRIESGRLFLTTGDTTEFVFSGRSKVPNERTVLIETIVRSAGFSRASGGDPVLGDLGSPYVVYRDSSSLTGDYERLVAQNSGLTALPEIDFANSIVVGAYLPLNGSVSSDIYVRSAIETDAGLEVNVAIFGPSIPDEASVSCASGDALTAPWTLVRIDSVIEPVRFTSVSRAYCSGIPVPD